MKTLNLHFGALSQPLGKQIREQGFSFDGKQMLNFQEQSEAILRLWFAGILTDSMKDKAQGKLFKFIKKHVQENLKPESVA